MARLALALSLTVALGTVVSTASAGSSGTADTACGSTPAMWNAPNGALVRTRGAGPVRDVIDGIGESGAHVIISHGTIGWASQASMYTPGTTGWPDYCSTPMQPSQLQYGFPGPEQINLGAMYTYIYRNGANEYARFKVGDSPCTTEAIANWLWSSSPYYGVQSIKESGNYFYRFSNNGGPVNYSLFQFRNVEGVPYSGTSTNNGMVCSSFAAWAQYRATGVQVSYYRYSASQKVNAINRLLSGVESSCSSGLGFWSGIGAAITCFEGICDDAARQVTNCMTASRCNTDDDGIYRSVRDNGTIYSDAISPDRMAGMSGHINNHDESKWAVGSDTDIAWNSPGSVYGCWF